MAEFVAFKAQNMNDLVFDESGSYFVFNHTAGGHEVNEFQVKSSQSNLVIDFYGIFTYKHTSGTYVLTGGTIDSFLVKTNGHNDYGFEYFKLPLMKFLKHSTPGHLSTSQFNMIMDQNITTYTYTNYIVGSRFNDVLLRGLPYNEFVFDQKPFGHDTIVYFNTSYDRIAFSHTIFHNPLQVLSHSHLNSHKDVVIKVDAGDTITLDNLHHVSNLHFADFLFI
jgi:hypothetical protein